MRAPNGYCPLQSQSRSLDVGICYSLAVGVHDMMMYGRTCAKYMAMGLCLVPHWGARDASGEVAPSEVASAILGTSCIHNLI